MPKIIYDDIRIPIERNLLPESVLTLRDLEIQGMVDIDLPEINGGRAILRHTSNNIITYRVTFETAAGIGTNASTNNTNNPFIGVFGRFTNTAITDNRRRESYVYFNLDNLVSFIIIRGQADSAIGTSTSERSRYRIIFSPIILNDNPIRIMSMSMTMDRIRPGQGGNNSPNAITIASSRRPSVPPLGYTMEEIFVAGNAGWEQRCFIGGEPGGGTYAASGTTLNAISGNGTAANAINAFNIMNSEANNHEIYKFDLLRNYLGTEIPVRYEAVMMFINNNRTFDISFRRLA